MRRFVLRADLVVPEAWVRSGKCPRHIMDFLKAQIWTGASVLVVGASEDAEAFCSLLANNRCPFDTTPLTTIEGIASWDSRFGSLVSEVRRLTTVLAHVASDSSDIEAWPSHELPFDLVVRVGSMSAATTGVTDVRCLDSDGQWQSVFCWERRVFETDTGGVVRGRFASTGVRPARDPGRLADGFAVDDLLFEWKGPWRDLD